MNRRPWKHRLELATALVLSGMGSLLCTGCQSHTPPSPSPPAPPAPMQRAVSAAPSAPSVSKEATAEQAAPTPPAESSTTVETPRSAAAAPVPSPHPRHITHLTRWTPVEQLKSADSGPGVIVCEPVATHADPMLAAFGAGCGRWLHFVVAGHAEFGKTPLWTAVDRARQELAKPDLRLTSQEAKKLSGMLGVTHVAVGEIAGTPTECTLTYQLWRVPNGKPVGAALTVSGSQDQVLAQLPQMARQLTSRLGVASPRVPAKLTANAAEMTLLGQVPWLPDHGLSAAQSQQIGSLAQRLPLAGLLLLRSSPPSNNTQALLQAAPIVNRLLEQAPDNPIVYGEIGWQAASALAAHTADMERNVARFPHSYLFAHTNIWLQRVLGDANAERAAAEQAVRNAYHCPEAWLSLGATISNEGEAIRRGRYSTALSSQEHAFLDKVYPQWLLAVSRAAQLDPLFGKAWLRTATAASFASDGRLADLAYTRAMSLDKDDYEMYDWGLQMYQRKWYYNPTKMIQVAQAAAEFYHYGAATYDVVGNLQATGLDAEARRLVAEIVTQNQEILRRNPKDYAARYNVARGLKEQGNTAEATRQFQALVQEQPNDADTHYMLGQLLQDSHRMPEATHEFQEAARLNPTNFEAYLWLGYTLRKTGHLPEAERAERTALRFRPDLSDGHEILGDVLLDAGRTAEAIKEYGISLRLDASQEVTWRQLCIAFALQKKFAQSIRAGEIAVRLAPNDWEAHGELSYAYGSLHQYAAEARHARESIRINPNNTTGHDNLADALMGMGKKQEAQAEWRLVLQINPNGQNANEARQELAKHP